MPEAFTIYLLRNKLPITSQVCHLSHITDNGIYVLEATLKLPSSPGNCSLRIERLHTVVRRGENAQEANDSYQTFRYYSPDVAIVVK